MITPLRPVPLDSPPPRPERAVPYDTQAEESVIGSLVLDRDAIIQVAHFLQPGHFFYERNGLIYRAILALYERREPPDFVTLGAELQRRGAGECQAHAAHCMAVTPTALHVEYYARIVRETAIHRRLITVGGQIAGLGYEEGIDSTETLTRAQHLLAEVLADEPAHGVTLAESLSAFVDALTDQQSRGAVPGIRTGLDRLDEDVWWEPDTLNLLWGPTSAGKTALALFFLRAALRKGWHVAVLSLEMDAAALDRRLLAAEGGIDMGTLRHATLGEHDWHALHAAAGRLTSGGRAWLIDAGITTVAALQVEIQRYQAQPGSGCDFVIVDYLQLLDGARQNGTRENEVSSISRSLKRLARQCHVPVLALGQVSNAALTRERPSLQDLRESGAPTHDASVCLALHRPAPDTVPHWVNLHVLKNRDGERDAAVPLYWQGRLQQYSEMTDADLRAAQAAAGVA